MEQRFFLAFLAFTKQQKDQHFQILPDLNTCIFDKKFTVALRQGTNTIKIPHGRNFTLKKTHQKLDQIKALKDLNLIHSLTPF